MIIALDEERIQDMGLKVEDNIKIHSHHKKQSKYNKFKDREDDLKKLVEEKKPKIEETKEKIREKEEEKTNKRHKDKNYQVNWQLIRKSEYRRKFDKITDNKKVNRTLYQSAKEILERKDGTKFEEMFLIHKDTGKVLYKKTTNPNPFRVSYDDGVKRIIKEYEGNIITIHNHPGSSIPSYGDFMAQNKYNYELGVIVAHNGDIFVYKSKLEKWVGSRYYKNKIDNLYAMGYNNSKDLIKELKKYIKIDKLDVIE